VLKARRPEKQRPEFDSEAYDWLLPDCPMHAFRRVNNAEAVMYHLPTGTAFDIVYDPDQTMIEGLTIFGFAARISEIYSTGQPPEDAAQLAAIGHDAIMAFLQYATRLL
jgi:hypothetical protein